MITDILKVEVLSNGDQLVSCGLCGQAWVCKDQAREKDTAARAYKHMLLEFREGRRKKVLDKQNKK